jgi:hypothetical protein
VSDPVQTQGDIGAAVTATAADGTACSVVTDEFGDFWIEDVEVGSYAVSIAADGFATRRFEAVDTAEDVNLGDIALSH